MTRGDGQRPAIRRPLLVGGAVAIAIAVWLAFVLNATRDNLRIDLPAIYAELGGTGQPDECPNLAVPPTREALLAARDLRDLARADPSQTVPNTNPDFGTLTAANAKDLVAGNVRRCVLADPDADPRWARIDRLLR